MNTNTAIIGGIVVVLVLIGGVYLYTQNSSTTIIPTPTGTAAGRDTTSTTQTPASPTVTTDSTAAPSDTAAGVSGNVNPNGSFTTYWFEYGTTPNLGNKIANQLVGSGFEAITTPGYITGLTKNTTYYYRLVAQNSYGTQSGTTYSFQTTVGTPAPVGSTPTTKTLAATGISRTTANLSGSVIPNKAATQFWFEYGKTPDLGLGSALQSVGDGSAVVAASLSLSSLDPTTTYYFRLNAQNQFGTTNGAILNFKTLAPPLSVVPVVTTQVASPIATTTVTLRGTVNPYGTQTTYWFEYSTDSGFASNLLKTTAQKSAGAGANTVSVTANLTALQPATTYYYRTVAQNSAGTIRGDSLFFKTN